MSLQKVNESLKFAGEVNIRKVEILASNGAYIDVTKQTAQVNVYEDLFSPFISLSIVIRESQDFSSALPLRGEETMTIEIATPTMVKTQDIIKGKFFIYKMNDRHEINKKSMVYVLHAISIEALYDLNTKHSKAYRGRISDIARSIITTDGLQTDKSVNIEDSLNAVKYTSNFWSPVKNLNYLSSLARNANESPTYLFYENRYGFNFMSLESLYTSDVYQKFIKDDYSGDTTNRGQVTRNLTEDYKRILDFKIKTVFDLLDNIPNGTYNSRMFTYDLVKKKYTVTDYSSFDRYYDQKHLNLKALNSEYKPTSPFNALFNFYKHYGMYDGFVDTGITKSFQERNSLIQMLNSNKVEITVLGRTDYTVGQKVNLKIPRSSPLAEKDQDDETVDNTYTGNYLITAINHSITKEKHEATMELCKESYI